MDDIGMAVKNDPNTVKAIFKDYSLFSKLSGIELNIDETEILKLNVNSSILPFTPNNVRAGNTLIRTSESIKICGITFLNNSAMAYNKNIVDWIVKLEKQIVRWLPRFLSIERKLTIVKTFGLSQLIYALQMCKVKIEDIKNGKYNI